MGTCHSNTASVVPVAIAVCVEDVVCEETFRVLRSTVNLCCAARDLRWTGGSIHTIEHCAAMLAENRPVQLVRYARELAAEPSERRVHIAGILISALNADDGECW